MEKAITDDAALLRQFVENNSSEAFGEVVRRQVDFVFAAALRQAGGNRALAADATQQVFADLARKAAAARHEALSGWRHTATR